MTKWRALMCPPDFYGVYYEINPWMSLTNPAHREKAASQWRNLYALYQELGVDIELIPPVDGLPDMVFTANAGVVDGKTFIGSNFRYKERRGEEPYFDAWFASYGYQVVRFPRSYVHEGMGDFKFFRDLAFAGFYFRSDVKTHLMAGEQLGKLVVSLELADPRFYHLDTCFCPLNEDVILFYPPAFTEYSQAAIRHHTKAQIAVGEEDALNLACNCAVLDDRLILYKATDALKGELGDLGFIVHEVDISEFLKSGGSSGCLTLML